MSAKKNFIPNEEEIKAAEALLLILQKQSGPTNTVKLDRMTISGNLVQAFSELLEQFALGHTVTLIASNKELTTGEAAEILNISRPFLVSLLDQGKIPFRKVGVKRRIRVTDLAKFQEKLEKEQERAFQELVDLGQVQKLGYDK